MNCLPCKWAFSMYVVCIESKVSQRLECCGKQRFGSLCWNNLISNICFVVLYMQSCVIFCQYPGIWVFCIQFEHIMASYSIVVGNKLDTLHITIVLFIREYIAKPCLIQKSKETWTHVCNKIRHSVSGQ